MATNWMYDDHHILAPTTHNTAVPHGMPELCVKLLLLLPGERGKAIMENGRGNFF